VPTKVKYPETGLGHGHAPERIVIERRETVAVIESDPYGTDPIVVVAFTKMGEVLNEQASKADTPDNGALEFEYMGVRFQGTYEPANYQG
jgi:hypothetical protein